ncbi:complement component 5-like protein, partial [Euroglyphus maynei]
MEMANLTCVAPNYFAEYSYKLPTIINNGQWEANVNCPIHKFNDRLTFEVRDYVAPRFRIDIDTPPVYLCTTSDEPLIIKLKATYTFGKPVNGYAHFKISIHRNSFEQKSKVTCLDPTTGTLEQSITLASNFCKNQHLPQRLLIEAIVTDLSTNQKDSATSDRTFLAKFPYRIWTRFTNLVYRPRLANYLAFELTDYDNNPMANIPIEIEMTDSNLHNIKPYIITSDDHKNIRTDSNGLVIFTFKIEESIGPLQIRISSRDPKYRQEQQTTLELSVFQFDYVNQNENDQPVILISNKKQMWYQAGQHYRSSIVHDGNIDVDQIYLIIKRHESIIQFSHINSSSLTIDIRLTNQMAPSIRLLVFAFTRSNDQHESRLVADFYRILVRQNDCGVQVKLDDNIVAKPGQNVTFTFNGHSGDVVALTAIDESVKILTSKNISSSNLKRDQSLQPIYRQFMPDFDITNPKLYYRSTDSISLIEDFGLTILSTLKSSTAQIGRYRRSIQFKCDQLTKHPCCQLAQSKFKKWISCEEKLFRLIKHLNRTDNKDCLRVSMPATIVQYEKTEISATVYNYYNESLSTTVHFYHVDGLCSDAYRSLDKATSKVTIMANGSETLIFPIIATRIGEFILRISAKSAIWSDFVEKNLIVLPPGERIEYSHSSDLDPTNRSKHINKMTEVIDEIYPERKYQKINISFHVDNNANIVPGTIYHRLSLIGRRFEPQLKSPDELAHLIRRRKSCGEQTAFYMAFNLHTLLYLQETGRLNRTLRKRGVRHLKRSFTDLISYRKPMDGSFAAFINRESSVWLTTFVANLLCHSEQFLGDEFDINLLSKSLDWIMRHQSMLGSWSELTHIHHRHADGGSNNDDDTLTAFVLITLHHCDSFITRKNFSGTLQTNWSKDYLETSRKGYGYLLDVISRTNHSYTMAIILYSLLLSPSSLSKTDSYNLMNHLLLQPDRHQDAKLNQMYYDMGSLTVETSAYVLLGLG